jgi:hypothetical protein
LDALEGLFYRNLHLAQGGNRPLDPHERRPPHDNHGQRPRNDDSDNSDDDDDDHHHPPGARIRRPVTPKAGPIPLPDHLDIARPGRDTRPVANAGPEEGRGLPPLPAQGGDPDPIVPAANIGAWIQALHGQYHIGNPPPPAPPTPATTFTNPDPQYQHTFHEAKFTIEALGEQYPEFTTSESFFSVANSSEL